MKDVFGQKGRRDVKRTPVILGLSAALCMPSAFVFANANSYVENETVQAVMQQRTVKGMILDETGEPLIGVSVLVKGTTIGTITDFDGNFTLSVPQGKNQLDVSYVGYKSQTVTLGSSNQVTVKMQPDTKTLDEVVVVGYGTVKKRDLTGAVTSMKTEDITAAPTNNVMEALQGKIAGMDIVKTSGQVGEDVSILLRGSRSIYGDNEPLFIIDGVPGSYSQVNPSDIETVDVLKDASSTAIYGSAGANGVVIITTKRGKEGKATVNFDAYYGFSGTPNYKHGMTGDEWVNYQKEAYKYKNGSYPSDMSALFNNQTYTDAYNAGQWIDWVDEVSGNTATTQKYSLSVTAGTEKTKIFASTSYNREEGLLDNDNLNKYQFRLNLDQQVFSWAKVGFVSNLTYQDRNQGVKNTFTKSLTSFPLGQAYDENGSINHEYISGQYSPLGDFIEDQYVNNTRSTYVNTSGYIEIKPIKDLTFTSRINGVLSNSRQGQYWGDQCNANRPSYASSPHAAITNKYAWNYTWDNVLAYNKTFAKDHNVGVSLISSWNKNTSESNIAAASGQLVDRWSFYSLTSGSSQHVESDYSQTQKMSYAVRLNYSYKGKYLFTFSNRWDGVSQFSDGHKWDSFPAAAIAWRISDEGFMENTKDWLNNLKLRVGYGITGNSGGVSAYATSTNAIVYSSNGISVNGKYVSFAQYTGTYGSPDLGWEKSYNWNVGLDFAVLNNRIDGSIEWFRTDTDGLLFKRTLPITSGVTGWGSPLLSWQNIAETSNTGVEASINSHNIRTKDFTWNTTLSVTWSKEKIESLPDGDLINESLFVGQPINSIYGYKYAGIWGTNATDEELAAYGVKPGYIKIETVEKDGDGGVHKYSTDDRQVLGHTNPDWIIGLNNTFTYKGFDLSVFAMARYGQTIQSSLLGYYTATQSVTTNQLSGVDYWTEDNQGAYFPRPGTGNEQSTVYSALTVRDGSFIKIKNITLGYTLPVNISRRVLMEKCRIYATAYNPIIYVKDKQLKGTDPETNGSDAFPTYRQFVFGVNLTF
jgi:TonB-linked SusC/RagA family outer membrane protein